MRMIFIQLAMTTIAAAVVALAAQPADFSGTWVFNPGKSENVGMMSQMEMSLAIRQSEKELVEKIDATMMGKRQVQEIRLELDGKPVPNDNYMGEKSTTTTHWDGPALVTTWTTPGAVPGSTHKSTETYSLSAGQTLTVRTARTGRPDIVMVYDRK